MRRSTTSKGAGRTSFILSALVLVGAVLAVLGTSAGASPHTAAATSATTTCTSTYSFAGNPDATVPCTTSTTTGTYTPRLTITYTADGHQIGIVHWQACGYPPSARGSTVRLELNGVITGPSGTILADGCTDDPHFQACLPQGSYRAVDVIQGYPSASATLVVDASSGCQASGGGTTTTTAVGGTTTTTTGTSTSTTTPGGGSTTTVAAGTAPAAGSGTGSSSSGGGVLAFTGANVLRAVIIALLAIAIGLVITRVSRRRRNATR